MTGWIGFLPVPTAKQVNTPSANVDTERKSNLLYLRNTKFFFSEHVGRLGPRGEVKENQIYTRTTFFTRLMHGTRQESYISDTFFQHVGNTCW